MSSQPADLLKERIRIGTMVSGAKNYPDYIRQILPHGFESFQLNYGRVKPADDISGIASQILEALGDSSATVSSVACFGNLLDSGPVQEALQTSVEILIDHVHEFHSDLVVLFAGQVPGKSIDESLGLFKAVYEPLVKRAADRGVRLAFENCICDWPGAGGNIANNPAGWEKIFNVLPQANMGLCWEPCHQMIQLIDPMPQLRKWSGRIFNVHGKDANVFWDVIREYGITGHRAFAFHRLPGFGDSNWTQIISELRRGGFRGSIDIEGWHDPVYGGELEMTGQVHALQYLKTCRGGAFVPNPA